MKTTYTYTVNHIDKNIAEGATTSLIGKVKWDNGMHVDYLSNANGLKICAVDIGVIGRRVSDDAQWVKLSDGERRTVICAMVAINATAFSYGQDQINLIYPKVEKKTSIKKRALFAGLASLAVLTAGAVAYAMTRD